MDGTMKRRGILAAAGAVVAGIVAKQASAPVAADNGTWQFPYTGTTGNTNASGDAFTVTQTGSGTRAIHGISGSGFGVLGTSTSNIGVYGESTSNIGVYGYSTGGFGVFGQSSTNHAVYGGLYTARVGKAGVYGTGNSAGTYGVIGDGDGDGTGVQGQNGQYGVVGKVSNVANSVAVYGQNTSATGSNNIGVYGVSNTGYGVLGVSGAGGAYSGITGAVYTATGAAFAGGAATASAYAAYFTGKVNIDGTLFVNGVQKFALKHADGSSRLVHGATTVEPVVEDFGKGQLANGVATVTLDADFREVADTSDYHVFLTTYGATTGVTVATQGAAGFTVREISGAGNGTFSYRVVARPKDSGGKVQRLARYESPNIKIPGINGEPMPPEVHAPTPEKPKNPEPPAPAPVPRSIPSPPSVQAPPAPAVVLSPAPTPQVVPPSRQ